MEEYEKPKKGRPPLCESEHRKNWVKVYFSDDELSLLDKLRTAAPRARYLREKTFLSDRQSQNINPLILPAIHKIGTNVNQIAKKMNEGQRVSSEKLTTQYRELIELFESINKK